MLAGTALLFGYGFSLNLAPVEFRQVVGLYVATLFVVWQVINFLVFRTSPNLPVLVGGTLVVAGGLLSRFGNPLTEREAVPPSTPGGPHYRNIQFLRNADSADRKQTNFSL